MKRKKIYRAPLIQLFSVDRELVLLQMSEDTPPDLPVDPKPLSTGSHPNSSNPNKFNNNPFEK